MTVKEVCEYLSGRDDVLILCHQNPDGDTLGSGFALYYALRQLGKTARVECCEPFPPQFDYLLPREMPEFDPRCVVAVDVADAQLLGEKRGQWGEKVDLCIDHHATNGHYAARDIIVPEAAATAEVMYEIISGMGIKIGKTIADCLYTGLSTDTGCFRYSNVTSHTMRLAAEMMDLGAGAYEINQRMYGIKSRARIAMEREALDSLNYYMGGKVAAIAVTWEMLDKTGAVESELEGLASIPREIAGVEVGLTLRQKPDGFKISIRTSENVDAAKLGAKFGGGGHSRSAGCFIKGSLEECREKIVAEAVKACEEAGF